MSLIHHRWPAEQLPAWEREGIVTTDGARKLRERYAAEPQGGLAQMVVGAALVGDLVLLPALLAAPLGRSFRSSARGDAVTSGVHKRCDIEAKGQPPGLTRSSWTRNACGSAVGRPSLSAHDPHT
jgi:hypothetical protein